MPENEITNAEILEFKEVYSPTTLLGVYASAIRSAADGRVILARGVYQIAPNQKDYGGYYYDSIKSPNENKAVKARIPSLLRSKIENNQIYTFKGYIEKKISFSSIELVFVIDDVLQKEENQISESDLKRFALIQQRIAKGFHDLEALVKEKVYKGEKIRIANLYGSTAIVNKDFDKGLAEASTRFQISEQRCNFASVTDLKNALLAINPNEFEAIALVRGGGDKLSLEIFNDPELGEAALRIKPLLITALGHTVDETLLDKLADKKFALPHDYGNSLKVWVDTAIEEQAKSKSVFIDQVKKDLTKTFSDQITTLQNQLQTKNKEFETAQQKFKEMVEQNQKDKLESIQTKERAFETQLKSLQEQIKTKDESLKTVQTNYENTVKHQVNSAVADMKTKYELANSENEKKRGNILIYLAIAAIAGLVIGFFIIEVFNFYLAN